MNQFFAYKTQVNKFWLNFFTRIINLLLIKQHKMIISIELIVT